MGELIAWNILSLDGFFEGAEAWDLSLHETVWDEELEALSNAQLAEAGALLFGRKTYEGMAAYWQSEAAKDSEAGSITTGMNALPKYVASKSLTSAEWNNTNVLSGDLATEVANLKREIAGTIFVFGSADLLATLLPAGLVDEYRLCFAPILLGAGTPLFKQIGSRIPFTLIESRSLANGGLFARYRPGSPGQ